eukprot:3530851-Rhodomonas_salina.1
MQEVHQTRILNEILQNNKKLRTWLGHKYKLNPIEQTNKDWESYFILLRRSFPLSASTPRADPKPAV